jgi:hypothetical protein
MENWGKSGAEKQYLNNEVQYVRTKYHVDYYYVST